MMFFKMVRKKNENGLPISVLTSKQLGSYHTYPHNKKKLNILKIEPSLRSMRELRSQGKGPPQNLEKQANTEKHSQGQLTGNSSYYSQ